MGIRSQKNRMWLMLSALLAGGLLPASCALAAAPTPAAKATVAPAKAETPAAKPATAPTPSTPAATPKPAVQEPRYGGILTISTYSNPVNLNPWEQVSITTLGLNGPVYSQLFQFDPFNNDKAVGDLVERWELSSDSRTYTLYLRKGVKWHDGQPFTAGDVKYSLDYMLDPKNPKVDRKRLNLIAINKVEVVDPSTVRLTLRAPSASLFSQLALPHSAIGAKHVSEKGPKPGVSLDWTVVGTGPMKSKNFLKDSYYEVVKNPEYFIKGRPYLDGVRYYVLTDLATRFAAFRTGQLLLTNPSQGLTPSQGKIAEKEIRGVTVVAHPKGNFSGFFMNAERKPWGDARVRKAVALATDHQAAVKALAEDVGDYGSPVIPGPWALPEDEMMKTPGYRQPKDADRAEAKRLLAEAGLPNGFKSPLYTRTQTEYVRIAEFMKDQLGRIGIDLNIIAEELAASTARRHAGVADWDTLTATAAVDNADPAGANKYFLKGNDFNFFDTEVDELWQKQDAIMDPAERKKAVFDAQRKFLEVNPWVVLFWSKNVTGFWPQVKNFKPSLTYTNLKHENTWLAK
ncbi:MAG: ABC transporter substrate-binding protein [Chloroflexi bacterium]|nr:ABC transporter substrate-binding protein [Chloroflexota bacterium]